MDPLPEKKVEKNVLEPLHERRHHDRHVKEDDEKAEPEMDQVKAEGRDEIKRELPLFPPEKAFGRLQEPCRRIFHHKIMALSLKTTLFESFLFF